MPNAPGFDIIYENGPVLGIVKPAGVATQAPRGIDSLEKRIKDYLREREGKSGNIYLAVPHRLDRAVSGAMVFARHVRAARKISTQFERREVRKVYWTIVEGWVAPARGRWRDWLRKVYGHPRTEMVLEDDSQGREAILHFDVLAMGRLPTGESATFLGVQLETGRTHQVRVQAASRGWPILGDDLYGARLPFGPAVSDERQRAIALHARSLTLRHPMSRETIELVAPLPEYWRQMCGDLLAIGSDATIPPPAPQVP